ncbi:hypothetical protein KP806_18245 [Paenibacillus sp. N4]|uniref:hypothetical protein n=1 Tax=Paenibacillus vietnamensis TaxID=2590547 RepID=UPI001CD04FC8|nr:hypothetical protein [Paenibacillus vietnamensis]MCA0757005.1 hypothetical protein [Paenibacillus vietnamensis]
MVEDYGYFHFIVEIILNFSPLQMTIVLLGIITALILLIRTFIGLQKVMRVINRFYPRRQHTRGKRKEMRDVLIRMNDSFTKHYNYMKYKSNKFLQFKKPLVVIAEGFYHYQDKRIRKKALQKIDEVLRTKYILNQAVDHYNRQISIAEQTIRTMHQDSQLWGYEKSFKKLYHKRINYLKNIISHCQKIVSELEASLMKCNNAIQELEKMKKPTIIDIAYNIAIAPIRHVGNIIDGIIEGNGVKIAKGGAFLGLGFLGIGAIADAIDALDVFDAMEIPSGTNVEFVDPHQVDGYMRSDGTYVDTYYRDGDANALTQLSKSEGGGYFRRG